MEADMKIVEVKERTPDLIKGLLEVWENSVRATHLFLSDSEIQSIKKYVPQALNEVLHLLIAEDESGRAVAFMGVEAGSLEMLFIAPEERGKGFYEHMGFQVYKRTDLDEQGNPYPLLYMRRPVMQ